MANFNQVYNFIARNNYSSAVQRMGRDTESFSNKIRRSQEALRVQSQRMREIGVSIRNAGLKMTAVATLPLVLLSRSMIKAASDAEETQNKFNVVFRSIEGDANRMADGFAKDFGVANSTAREMLSSTGDLLTGFNFTEKEALALSLQVAQLGSDLASFSNFAGGADGAAKALTSAMLGETEAAKALGIKINQGSKEFKDQVKVMVRVKGITEAQAKAQVILNMATIQSKKAIGDTNRTFNDYANVVRRSSEKTKELKESFGRILLPMALKIMKVVLRLTTKFEKMDDSTKKTILTIGGIVAVAGPALIIIGSLATGIAALTTVTLAASGAFMALIARISIGGLVLGLVNSFIGLQVALTAIPSLSMIAAGALGFLQSTMTGVAVIAGTIGAPFLIAAALIVGAGFLIFKNWEGIKGGIITIVDQLSEKIMGLKDSFLSAFEFIKNLAIDFINNFTPVGQIFKLITGGELIQKSEVSGQIDIGVTTDKGTTANVRTKRKRGPRLKTGQNEVGTT